MTAALIDAGPQLLSVFAGILIVALLALGKI
jgi:hypothetical protein